MEEISASESSNLALGNITSEIKNLMSTFTTCTIRYVNQLCNYAAHKLARNAWHVYDALIWLNSAPAVIEQIVWLEGCNLEPCFIGNDMR